MTRRALRGAAWGAVAWLVYGAVELILSAGVQLWRFPETEILGWQWRLIAMLMGAYAVLGLVVGFIGGVLAPRAPHIFASATIALAFVINLIPAWPLARSENIALAAAVLVSGVAGAAAFSERMRKRLQFLTGPWTISLLALAAPWVSREALGSRPPAVKTGLSLLLMGAVVGAAAAGSRLRNGRAPALGSQAALAILAMGTFAAVAEIAQRPAQVSMDRRAQPPGPQRPNVLLITMDTVRADHTSLYGYERDTTPNLREFAKAATLYTRAIATSDFTLPTHASIFTGIYPEWHGAVFSPANQRHEKLRADRTTLAEILNAHGYWTAESVANYAFLSAWNGLARGFAVADAKRPVLLSRTATPFLRNPVTRLLSLVVDARGASRLTRTAGDIGRRAGVLLEQAKRGGGPFLLFFNYMDAHVPYLPEQPFDLTFPGKDPRFSWDRYLSEARRAHLRRDPLSAAEKSHAVSQYDGAIAAEDRSIGSLLEKLRQLELYDGTLIIVTADHGEAFGEHDLLGHERGNVYSGLVSVPLLVKYPGQRAGRRSDDPVSQIDILSTVLELAGIPAPGDVQGVSLLHPVGRARSVFSSAVSRIPAEKRVRRAITEGSLKLIAATSAPPELYDLSSDPDEEHNLYSPEDPRAVGLGRRLDAWVQSMPRENVRPGALDPAARERLKSLGYAQ